MFTIFYYIEGAKVPVSDLTHASPHISRVNVIKSASGEDERVVEVIGTWRGVLKGDHIISGGVNTTTTDISESTGQAGIVGDYTDISSISSTTTKIINIYDETSVDSGTQIQTETVPLGDVLEKLEFELRKNSSQSIEQQQAQNDYINGTAHPPLSVCVKLLNSVSQTSAATDKKSGLFREILHVLTEVLHPDPDGDGGHSKCESEKRILEILF
ncbi:uncharacterized protein LOC118753692 [Rhagoletis pomonella]|uniref:uncharacterized protein LOC118753692 n=1 Tax=Rhagoletis pomonella TaxID=28610 RepID=UPI0017872937|nr:uncharacterized protein LOC118753692 [Rhagoletis pomonella]